MRTFYEEKNTLKTSPWRLKGCRFTFQSSIRLEEIKDGIEINTREKIRIMINKLR